jgi:hypothetical protein
MTEPAASIESLREPACGKKRSLDSVSSTGSFARRTASSHFASSREALFDSLSQRGYVGRQLAHTVRAEIPLEMNNLLVHFR